MGGPVHETSDPVGVTRLQAARAAQGWSQTQVIARLRQEAARAGVAIPDDTSLKTQLSRWERGVVRRISPEYRRLLRAVYGRSDDELGLQPAEPLPVQRAEAERVTRFDPDVASYFSSLLVEHVRADNRVGPRPVLGIVEQQTSMLNTAVRGCRGADRALAVRLACRYEEFLGWLYQDGGQLGPAMLHTDRARDFATELGDPTLAAYLLMRKSNIATDGGDPALALALVEDALKHSAELPARVRAAVLRQKAHAMSGLTQPGACADLISMALETTAQASKEETDVLAGYVTPGYVAMEAATCWLRLDRPELAMAAFDGISRDWPTRQRRDHGMHLARRARAHAGVGDVAIALELGEQAVDAARATASVRTVWELRRLARRLVPWQGRRDTRTVLSGVASLVASTI